ncbi:MAG: RNA-binding S4 domain-containing protein [Pyrinomonadaceae bacterium]|nr:RNA-binding S4 domain-containing protein [Pyrinomonadaceae bacterium]
MRLDLFLKSSRIILRRSLAQQFCEAGLVKVNSVAAKSSREVKVNDEIEIKRSNKLLTVRVLQIPQSKQVSRQAASSLFEVVSEESCNDSLFEGGVEIEVGDNKNNPIT